MSARQKTRLGWAEESRARAEAKRLHPEATIRQLRDLSWATRTPDGTYRGRFGELRFVEQAWRDDSPAGRDLEAATGSLRDEHVRRHYANPSPAEKRAAVVSAIQSRPTGRAEDARGVMRVITFEVELELTEKERKAIGRALGRKGKRVLASDEDVIHWARAELGLATLALHSEAP
jgi:hypothetical protein